MARLRHMRALPATADSEEEFLVLAAGMPHEYLVCRSSQHRWPLEMPPFRVVDSRVEDGEYAHKGEVKYAKRVVECDRCGAKRHDYYAMTSRRGHTILQKLDARYDLPPGYATRGLGRVADMRGLILGVMLELELNEVPVRGRGRPSKKT